MPPVSAAAATPPSRASVFSATKARAIPLSCAGTTGFASSWAVPTNSVSVRVGENREEGAFSAVRTFSGTVASAGMAAGGVCPAIASEASTAPTGIGISAALKGAAVSAAAAAAAERGETVGAPSSVCRAPAARGCSRDAGASQQADPAPAVSPSSGCSCDAGCSSKLRKGSVSASFSHSWRKNVSNSTAASCTVFPGSLYKHAF
mmetsp:Transcript_4195/g.7776  ORF Transcript_4195/g.7776 Transcript_4195/m.7776 type:complete len:205 (+) Transcript_4195:800-1414(+)